VLRSCLWRRLTSMQRNLTQLFVLFSTQKIIRFFLLVLIPNKSFSLHQRINLRFISFVHLSLCFLYIPREFGGLIFPTELHERVSQTVANNFRDIAFICPSENRAKHETRERDGMRFVWCAENIELEKCSFVSRVLLSQAEELFTAACNF
jgi:hypothetical protein